MALRARPTLRAIVLILTIYLGSYWIASMHGAFEQVFTDANSQQGNDFVEKVAWTPSFVGHENVFNDLILLPYWPLCTLDRKYWHLSDDAFNGKYPLAERLALKMRQL